MGSTDPWYFLQISFRFEGSPWASVIGLYDPQGILRCVGASSDACVEYADLFGIPLSQCSLEVLPEPVVSSLRVRGPRVLEGRSS